MADYVRCSNCGKRVSNEVETELVVRAFVECPECIEKRKGEASEIGKMDTLNEFAVTLDLSGNIRIQFPPAGPISKERALRLAGWIVALTTFRPEIEFMPVLEAILKT